MKVLGIILQRYKQKELSDSTKNQIALYSFNMMNKSNRRYSNAANLDITITLEDSAKLFKQNVSNIINEKVYVIKDKYENGTVIYFNPSESSVHCLAILNSTIS